MKTKKKTMDYYKFERGFNIRKFVVVLAFLMIVAYGAFNSRSIIFGPSIEIFAPLPTEVETSAETLVIKGRARNISFLSLNERPVFTDIEGFFEEKLLLSPGANTITVKAQDRFKNEKEKMIKVYYKPKANLDEN